MLIVCLKSIAEINGMEDRLKLINPTQEEKEQEALYFVG